MAETETEMGVASIFADLDYTHARSAFQWGGTISSLFLLLMNRIGRRSHMQTNLLVLYLFSSFPTVLFKFLRGQFGFWVAFLAVASNLFFPTIIPGSRFILFVITPDWVADILRDGIAPGIFCFVIAVLLILTEICGTRRLENSQSDCHCFCYWLGVAFLVFFTIVYFTS